MEPTADLIKDMVDGIVNSGAESVLVPSFNGKDVCFTIGRDTNVLIVGEVNQNIITALMNYVDNTSEENKEIIGNTIDSFSDVSYVRQWLLRKVTFDQVRGLYVPTVAFDGVFNSDDIIYLLVLSDSRNLLPINGQFADSDDFYSCIYPLFKDDKEIIAGHSNFELSRVSEFMESEVEEDSLVDEIMAYVLTDHTAAHESGEYPTATVSGNLLTTEVMILSKDDSVIETAIKDGDPVTSDSIKETFPDDALALILKGIDLAKEGEYHQSFDPDFLSLGTYLYVHTSGVLLVIR